MVASDVAILGERHDNPLHHNAQARLVSDIEPAALVFEMIPAPLALAVASSDRTDPDRLAARLNWEARGWPDFSMYWPIFQAAPDAILFGAEVSRGDIEAAMESGAADVLGGWADLFGLNEPVDPAVQSELEAEMAAAHCNALPEEMLPAMVEAQRLRDASLARAVLAAHAETGGPVAVIAGNGHARRDTGVPALLARAAPELDVVVLGQFEVEPAADAPFDLWTVAPAPPDRGDPCDALR